MKQLLIPASVFLLGLFGAVEPFLKWYTPSHHVGMRKMAAAEAAPQGRPLVVVTGDSRSVAAFDYPTLKAGLERRGYHFELADIALESTNPTWQCIALEQYLANRPDVEAVVIGVNSSRLLNNPHEPDPSSWSGSLLTNFLWARPVHFRRLYPGFPRDQLDAGLRYQLRRLTYLGSYCSLLQIRWTQARDRLFGIEDTREANRFGAIEDLKDATQVSAAQGQRALETARTRDTWRINPLFLGLLDDLQTRGITLVVVELPMHSGFRNLTSHSPSGLAYRAWLARELASRGAAYLDFSAPSWATDDHFPDFSHITPESAHTFSRQFVDALLDALPPSLKAKAARANQG